jgi:hypothetical protein
MLELFVATEKRLKDLLWRDLEHKPKTVDTAPARCAIKIPCRVEDYALHPNYIRAYRRKHAASFCSVYRWNPALA